MPANDSLKKSLGLADVYAISTGAMFSSGFFLLPGIAAIEGGSSVALAYLVAAVLILPAMLSVAELSTAMPRAGGAYYFLDRSMGPLMGTIGGLGTWLALILKSAFALLGMGAYLMLFVDVPIQALAVGLTVVFALINVVGAKETSGLQRTLVAALVVILGFYIVQGVAWVLGNDPAALIEPHRGHFFEHGFDGLLTTAGIVFVSFAGLTKVASVAEEVRDPDRNIPLGMMLSLGTATFIYVVGVALMTLVLDAEAFHQSYTPVADAGRVIMTWVPQEVGLWLIVIAATAAFASTGNAGILSSSRYPMAMARDQLVPDRFATLSKRFATPVLSIVVTAAMIIVLVLAFDITAVAKLASAFQLMLFGLINLAVVVMRESRIDYYNPGYRSPLYPWVQIAGILIPIFLIAEMGWLAIVFTAGVIAVCLAWYFIYASRRTARSGAIYHVFERLGRQVYRGLDDELRDIVAEKGLHAGDPVEQLVLDAKLVELHDEAIFVDAIKAATVRITEQTEVDPAALAEVLVRRAPGLSVINGFALAHASFDGMPRSELVLVRAPESVLIPGTQPGNPRRVYAMAVLVGPEAHLSRHLRMLAHFGRRVGDFDFKGAWTEARTPAQVREVLLREDRYHRIRVKPDGPTAGLVGKKLREAKLTQGVIIALMQRHDGAAFAPGANDVIRVGDRLTAIGDPEPIALFRTEFGESTGAWPQVPAAASTAEVLLREDRHMLVRLAADGPTARLIGVALKDAGLPAGVIVALIQRDGGEAIAPVATDAFMEGDLVTVIGDPEPIERFRKAFGEFS